MAVKKTTELVKLSRNKAKVMEALQTNADGSVSVSGAASGGVQIVFPERFTEIGLADVSNKIQAIGAFTIISGSHYSVFKLNAMIRLGKTVIGKTRFNDVPYYVLDYAPGQIMIEQTTVLQNDAVLFKIYREFHSNGKVPWYFNYTDMGSVFATAKEFTGAGIADNRIAMELLTSLVARQSSDLNEYYRTMVESEQDLKKEPTFIALKSVQYAATNTVNKIVGSYFQDGVISALNNPTERVEPVERVLRA